MRDQVLWRKTGRIAALLADRLNIDTERALDLLYNSPNLRPARQSRQRIATAKRYLYSQRPSARVGGVVIYLHQKHQEQSLSLWSGLANRAKA